ncbi:MAG: hypothetical protein Tsb0026_16580 [Sulfuricaulis sp.]
MRISRLTCQSIGAMLLGLSFFYSALAEHRDPAPIPDEATNRVLDDLRRFRPHPLPDLLDRNLDEASSLIRETEQDETDTGTAFQRQSRWETRRSLIAAKVHEFETLRTDIRNHFASTRAKLKSLGLTEKVKEWDKLKAQVENRFDRVQRALNDVHKSKDGTERRKGLAGARAELDELHEKVKRRQAVPDTEATPSFELIQHVTQPPENESAPAPQYLSSPRVPGNYYAFLGNTLLAAAPNPTPTEASTCSYTEADLEGANLATSPEVQITQEIKNLAEKLGYSPVKIYQYVYNEIAYEPYYGSLKGAIGTLVSGAGNATDQASLLIALLRASNIPARYVKGNIRFVNDPRSWRWVGAKSQVSTAYIIANGYAPWTYTSGTQTLETTHVWVEACVPYGNYRGASVDQSGHRWIPLDPSFKDKTYQVGIPTNVNFDYSGAPSTYMATRTNTLPHEKYEQQVETWIKTQPPNYSNNTLQDVGYIGEHVPRQVDILPTSLPYEVVSFVSWTTGGSAETAQVPDSHRYKLSLTVQNSGGTQLLTTVLSYPQMALQRITLSYKPATAADQTIWNTWSGDLKSLPASLNVLPVIKREGIDQAVGGISVPLGNTNTLTMKMTLGDFQPTSPKCLQESDIHCIKKATYPNIVAGSYHALHAYARETSDKLLADRTAKLLLSARASPPPTTPPPYANDETLGEFLHLSLLKYMRYIDDAARTIGELDGVSARSSNHLGLTSSNLKVQYLFDLPFAVFPGALYIDVAGGGFTSLDISTGDLSWKTFKLITYAGSAYEHYIWQENARLDAVSTVRGLQFAAGAGIPIRTFNSSNIGSYSSVMHSSMAGYQAQITSYVNVGYTVTVPQQTISYQGSGGQTWTGAVYMAEKVNFGIGAIISGGLSGGWAFLQPPSYVYSPIIDTGWLTPIVPPTTYTAPPSIINSGVGTGITSYTTTAGDPVNMVTGNMYHTERDISIKGRGGLPIVFERSYNSRDAKDGPLGFGWTHSFNHYLLFKDDNVDGNSDSGDTDNITSSVSWIDGTGSEKFIQVTGSVSGVAIGSSFTPPPGFFFQTTRNTDGTYSIREKNGLTYTFENVAGTPSGVGSQSFTTVGPVSFTVPAGVYSLKITMAGGGGGGGGGNNWGDWGSGGGGGGGYSQSAMAVTPGQVITGSVGAGGPAGGYSSSGGNGQSSAFGALTATGGQGGQYQCCGGAGGSPGGQAGSTSISGAGGNSGAGQGMGGDSGSPGGLYGGGGGGGYTSGSPAPGAGAQGRVKVEWNPTAGQKGAKLLNIKDRNGNTLTMGYNGANLTSVTDGLGRVLTFTPDGNNRISQIGDWTGRQWKYEYNTNGDLITYKNPLAVSSPTTQPPVTYSYYTATDGQNLNHAMKQYTLPRGNGMTFEYYMNGRVFRHYNTLGETMTFTYNDFRRETVSVNERGFERHFFFDANGNPLKIVEENGAIREYTYEQSCPMGPCLPFNPFNRLTKRDPMGYVTGYQYDASGNVTRITSPSGNTVEYSYFNTFNQPGKIKDARGNYTILKYDIKGNVLQEIKLKSGYGATTDPVTYTPVGSQTAAWSISTNDNYGNVLTSKRVLHIAEQAGPTIEYNYNDTVNGVVGLNAVTITRRGDKDGSGTISASEFDTANLTYDGLGRVTTGIDADWHPKQYFYDSLDRVTRATDAVGNLRDYVYDQNGNPAGERLVMSINGVPTQQDSSSISYDSSDRRQLALDAAGNAMRYDYDASGNVVQITNPDNYSLSFEYDAGNHMVKAADREGNSVTRTLDLDGKPRAVTDPNGNTVKYDYYGPEQEGRLKKQFDGVGRATTYEYDANGNTTKVTDHLGRTTLTTYDELNRPTRLVSPSFTHATLGVMRPVVKYTYNNLGYLTQVSAGRTDSTGTNPVGDIIATQMTYVPDDFGRPLKATDALGKFWTHEYDVNNNVTKVTDAKGQVTQYTWDHGHQLKTRTDYSGKITYYTRNALGQPITVQSPAVSYNYAYDEAHRLKSVNDSRGNKTLTYAYSPGGLLNTLTDPEGQRTDYVYDPVGRLTGLWAPNGNNVAYAYDAGGRLTEKWMPNGVKTRYQYNPDNTLTQLVNRNPSGGVVSQHDYTYDNVGNRATHIELINGTTTPYKYVYDELNRLKEVRHNTTNALIAGYSHDWLDLRETQTDASGTRYYLHDSGKRLLEIRQSSITGPLLTGFVYDANGNLTKKCEGGTVTRSDTACSGTTTTTLTYDALDQLTQATKTGIATEAYVYDPEGRRIQKTVGSTATHYLYNGPDIEAEYASTSWTSSQARYVHGPSWDDPVLRSTSTTSQYYHQDGLGSITAVTDAAGTVTGSARYDAWGLKLSSTGSIPQYGYTGREPDATGLVYYRARYYDPSVGRFTQRDPQGFVDGVNRYAYVRNNPVNYTDPTGTTAFNNNLTNLATLNTSYFGTSTSSTSGLGYISSGSQSLASITPSPSSSFSGLGTSAYTGGPDLPLEGSFDQLGTQVLDTIAPKFPGTDVRVMFGVGATRGIGSTRTFQTYTRTNPATGEVYSGRTSGFGAPEQNIAQRNAGSPLNNQGFGRPFLDQSSTNPAAIRGREQLLIENFGGAKSCCGTSANKINGISPTNPNRNFYLEEALKDFGTLPPR